MSAANNNAATLHVQKLFVQVLRLVRQMAAAEERAPQATNALYLARTIVCHLTKTQAGAAGPTSPEGDQ